MSFKSTTNKKEIGLVFFYKRKIKRKLIILVTDNSFSENSFIFEKRKNFTFSISLFLDQEVVWGEDVIKRKGRVRRPGLVS